MGEVDKFTQWSTVLVISRPFSRPSWKNVRPSLTSEGASRFPSWKSGLT